MKVILATLVIILAICRPTFTERLLIGAFNVKTFGKKKMENPDVRNILSKIVARYDILLVQEIRDISETAFPKLIDAVNDHSISKYTFVLSPRLGKSKRYKEQYGFVYKYSSVNIIGTSLYLDTTDIFEREPYSVHFERLTETGAQRNFTFVPLHAKPKDAIAEINALIDVYHDVSSKFGEDVLFGGDFNSDCSYVCASCWNQVKFWTNGNFTWLIDSTADTTVSKSTDCAYDRFVVSGKSMIANSENASVFYFDTAFGLTNKETKRVSDHYPVEFYLN